MTVFEPEEVYTATTAAAVRIYRGVFEEYVGVVLGLSERVGVSASVVSPLVAKMPVWLTA